MVYNEKLKELVGQCPKQSGLVLVLALLPFKVRADNFQRSLPTNIFLWLGCTFLGMWTMLFHLVHLGFTSWLKSLPVSDKSDAVREVPVFTRKKEEHKTHQKRFTADMECWS